jgi:hypothetical protein
MDPFPAQRQPLTGFVSPTGVLGGEKQLSYPSLGPHQAPTVAKEGDVGPWELRVGRFRVFYKVEQDIVTVVAVGSKQHNKLFIRGKEVQL